MNTRSNSREGFSISTSVRRLRHAFEAIMDPLLAEEVAFHLAHVNHGFGRVAALIAAAEKMEAITRHTAHTILTLMAIHWPYHISPLVKLMFSGKLDSALEGAGETAISTGEATGPFPRPSMRRLEHAFEALMNDPDVIEEVSFHLAELQPELLFVATTLREAEKTETITRDAANTILRMIAIHWGTYHINSLKSLIHSGKLDSVLECSKQIREVMKLIHS